ncbi:MAG: aminotransferase class I/II-fold pyridoxal phosphate-dependent enzyme, partial [Negativicoccus succinicivorans]|nr:aminotransferase class I/II-fold pyridoxal phosphate-dependent enzyme [Negativicoccus succinicivorans]
MKFSRLTQNFAPSDIDMLLKLTAQPEVISFGGGLPAPETFPIETLAAVTQEVFAKDGVAALQYGPSRGYLPLREYLSDWFQNHLQTTVVPDDILITAGSQQGLDLLARVFLDPGDVLLVEGPSYIGALNAFDLAQPTYVEMPMDEEGVIPEALAEILATQKKVKA